MELPIDSPFFSAETGIDKAAVVRDARDAGRMVAFAGDGFPDLPAALLVPDPLRFAHGDLAIALAAQNVPFRPFTPWADVAHGPPVPAQVPHADGRRGGRSWVFKTAIAHGSTSRRANAARLPPPRFPSTHVPGHRDRGCRSQ